MTHPTEPVMDSGRPPRFTGRLVVGLAIIAVGVVFLLQAFHIPGADSLWDTMSDYWPVLLILVGISKLVNARFPNERFGGFVWTAAGLLLLAYNMNWIRFDVWNVIWPVLIILFGMRLVGRAMGGGMFRGGSHVDASTHTHAFALWSGVVRKQSSIDFRGGEATAVMGGCDIDLRQCDITHGPAVFDAFAMMGGVEIKVPGNWEVRNEGIAILGGFDDSRKETAGDPSKVLILRGMAIMGGVEIKN